MADPLQDKLFVPGVARCPKCEFRLIKTDLFVLSGTAGAGDVTGEQCPNCDVPLWRVSWKDEAEEYARICDQQIERAAKLERALQYIADGMGETQPVAIGMLAPNYARTAISEQR